MDYGLALAVGVGAVLGALFFIPAYKIMLSFAEVYGIEYLDYVRYKLNKDNNQSQTKAN